MWHRAGTLFSGKGVVHPKSNKASLPLSHWRGSVSPAHLLYNCWELNVYSTYKVFPTRKAKIHKMTSTDLFSWRQSKRSVGMLQCQRCTQQNIPECSLTSSNFSLSRRFGGSMIKDERKGTGIFSISLEPKGWSQRRWERCGNLPPGKAGEHWFWSWMAWVRILGLSPGGCPSYLNSLHFPFLICKMGI